MAEPGDTPLFAAVTDLNGCWRGKRLSPAAAARLEAGGLRMPLSALGVDVWGRDVAGLGLVLERGDLDGICRPTGRGPVDGPDGRLVPLWMFEEGGAPFAGDPRQALAMVLARLAARGLTPVAAMELEFHLLAAAPDVGQSRAAPPRERVFSLDELGARRAFLDEVFARAEAAGIAVDSAISEGGDGQFEITVSHRADALAAADDAVLLRALVRGTARAHGLQATFMARPMPGGAGNGLHIHLSLLDGDGRNVFDDGGPQGSDTLRRAVAGVLAAAPALTLIHAPHLNSQRRHVPGGLAPTTFAWAFENRTAALRIPGGPAAARRIEHRIAGADANPYLVMAAFLASALDGIERGLTPPAPARGNTHEADAPSIPADWPTAIAAFAGSDTPARLLGPAIAGAFLAGKRQEAATFAEHMSRFEIDSYRHAF